MGILPSDFDEQDYYRMAEIMNAKKKEDRPVSGRAFMEQLGYSESELSGNGKEV